MQRDFVDPIGFGEALGNNVSLLQKAILPTKQVLEAARGAKFIPVRAAARSVLFADRQEIPR